MGKSKKTTTSTQTTTPTASPEISFALGNNQNLFNMLSGREAAPFQTYTDFSPASLAAQNLTIDRAINGSGVVDAAKGAVTNIADNGVFDPATASYISQIASGQNQYLLPTARGDYLDFANNPAYQRGVGTINDSVGSIFERSGRTGSGANQSSVARGIGDFAAGVYGQERANQLNAANALTSSALSGAGLLNAGAGTQLQAAGLAPGLAATDYADLQALSSVGAQQEGKAQEQIADQLYRYNFPYENAIQANNILTANTGMLGPLLGGTTSGKQEETTSGGLFNSILGGLLTAGSLFAGGGIGGAAGAAGGPSPLSNPYSYLAGGSSAPSYAPSPISLFGGG